MQHDKITISGLICTGKSTLFAGLKRELSWPAFSASVFFRAYSRQHQLSIEKAQEQEEKVTRGVDLFMREILKTPGNLLVEGWMAGIMANGIPGVLRLLLTCQREERYHRFARRDNLSLAKARRMIVTRERNLFNKLKAIHGRDDVVDPKNYNFVLDTTNLGEEEMVKRVLDTPSLQKCN